MLIIRELAMGQAPVAKGSGERHLLCPSPISDSAPV